MRVTHFKEYIRPALAVDFGQCASLNESWGKGWEGCFDRFSFTPLAAASIGQATLLRMSGILLNRMGVAPLIQEPKRQLQNEKTEHLRRFDQLLADSPDFLVTRAYAQFRAPNTLVSLEGARGVWFRRSKPQKLCSRF